MHTARAKQKAVGITMIDESNLSSHWNAKRGLNRLFVVLALCWYVAAGWLVWPNWATAIKAEREAQRILDPEARNATGHLKIFLDEIDTPPGAPIVVPVTTADGQKVSPMLRIPTM